MKSNLLISLIALFVVFSPAILSQQNPEAVWSILSIDETDRTAGILSSFLPLESNDDIRIHPTTNTTQSEMSVAVSPLDNHIILVSANATNFPVTTIYGTGVYWSTDGGITWQGFDQPPTGNNKGDPAAAIDLNGYFYVGGIAPNSGQGIMRSTNGGNNWVYFQVSNPASPFGLLDKNHLTVDNNPNSPHAGNLYAAWSDFGQSIWPPIEFARSTDRGEHWINEQNISANEFSQGVNLQTGPNGEVYATWAIPQTTTPFTEKALGFNKSTNGGQNWGIPTRAIENIHGIRAPNNGPYFQPYNIRANSFPSMAVSQITGHIYIRPYSLLSV